jgi:hypothetical protein
MIAEPTEPNAASRFSWVGFGCRMAGMRADYTMPPESAVRKVRRTSASQQRLTSRRQACIVEERAW